MSGDYTYGDDRAVNLHDSDSSQNDAQALDGYRGDVDLDSSWEGLDPDPNEQRADPEKMREVATSLRGLAKEIKTSQAPGNVQSRANETQFGPGHWQAANYLKAANTSAAGLVVGGVDQVAANLEAAATAIEGAADAYEAGESTNETSFSRA